MYNSCIVMNKVDEHELVRKAKAGDATAMEALIRAHQQGLYAFILRMCGRPEVAEDIVQEAFVRVLANLNRFDTRFRFSTWLFTIAKRLYMNSVQKLCPNFDSEILDLHQTKKTDPRREVAREETMSNARGIIDAALDTLGPLQREIVMMFHQLNWPIADISVHLDMPQGTVKSHLHRARKRMRQFIENNGQFKERVQEVWA